MPATGGSAGVPGAGVGAGGHRALGGGGHGALRHQTLPVHATLRG